MAHDFEVTDEGVQKPRFDMSENTCTDIKGVMDYDQVNVLIYKFYMEYRILLK